MHQPHLFFRSVLLALSVSGCSSPAASTPGLDGSPDGGELVDLAGLASGDGRPLDSGTDLASADLGPAGNQFFHDTFDGRPAEGDCDAPCTVAAVEKCMAGSPALLIVDHTIQGAPISVMVDLHIPANQPAVFNVAPYVKVSSPIVTTWNLPFSGDANALYDVNVSTDLTVADSLNGAHAVHVDWRVAGRCTAP